MDKLGKHGTFSARKNVSKLVKDQPLAETCRAKKTPNEKTACSFAASNDQRIYVSTKQPTKPHKRLVRRVEEKVDANKVSVVQLPEITEEFYLPLIEDEDTVEHVNYRCKYDKPELHSSLAIAKKLQVMSQAVSTSIASDSRSKQQAVTDKVGSKIAFRQEEQLYHDLVGLEINKDDVVSNEAKKRHKHVGLARSRDLEPQLSDFYQPSSGEEYSAPCQPKLIGVDRIRRYNGFSLYKRCKAWEQTS